MSLPVLSIDPFAQSSFTVHHSNGETESASRSVIAEVPVALEFNGFGYAVMMATPVDLEDFMTGFALSERLIETMDELGAIETVAQSGGILLRANLAANRQERLIERVRHRTSDSSCGLCGIESLEQALRPLTPVTSQSDADSKAIFRAHANLRDCQPLNAATGAAHAAAACSSSGEIRMVREDVGRHNAFDKLIGAMARQGLSWEGGFALISSRCSYELVEKAVLSNCPMLAAISAPTALALDRAQQAGLKLVSLARTDSFLMAGD
jgi:FdhD protein